MDKFMTLMVIALLVGTLIVGVQLMSQIAEFASNLNQLNHTMQGDNK
jgi:predicted PurR-regulated permease PerM